VNDDDFAELFKQLNSGSNSGASWEDVAAELGALGKTLRDVARGVVQRQVGNTQLSVLRDALQARIDELERALEGTPEAQRAREQLTHAAESLRQAADRATEELRPELLSMLRQANAELRRFSEQP
jgi:hypothetical protein